jgi:molecular chaperone GrpE
MGGYDLSDHHKKQPGKKGDPDENSTQIPVEGAEESMKEDHAPGEDEKVVISAREYEELVAQVEELKDRYLRTAADFDNYRKRMEKEKEDIICFANERLVSDLLPILDNLERALAANSEGADMESILDGVRMVNQQLESVLTVCGLEPVHAVGRTFDPQIHEAVGVLPSGEHDEGTVLAELQKGYKLKGKVLRHSMVHVAGQADGNSEEGER